MLPWPPVRARTPAASAAVFPPPLPRAGSASCGLWEALSLSSAHGVTLCVHGITLYHGPPGRGGLSQSRSQTQLSPATQDATASAADCAAAHATHRHSKCAGSPCTTSPRLRARPPAPTMTARLQTPAGAIVSGGSRGAPVAEGSPRSLGSPCLASCARAHAPSPCSRSRHEPSATPPPRPPPRGAWLVGQVSFVGRRVPHARELYRRLCIKVNAHLRSRAERRAQGLAFWALSSGSESCKRQRGRRARQERMGFVSKSAEPSCLSRQVHQTSPEVHTNAPTGHQLRLRRQWQQQDGPWMKKESDLEGESTKASPPGRRACVLSVCGCGERTGNRTDTTEMARPHEHSENTKVLQRVRG